MLKVWWVIKIWWGVSKWLLFLSYCLYFNYHWWDKRGLLLLLLFIRFTFFFLFFFNQFDLINRDVHNCSLVESKIAVGTWKWNASTLESLRGWCYSGTCVILLYLSLVQFSSCSISFLLVIKEDSKIARYRSVKKNERNKITMRNLGIVRTCNAFSF